MLTLPRFSFGVGDRFAHEAEAQLAAFQQLADAGVVAAPVWNKSHREHSFIGSKPESVRAAAAAAVAATGWQHPWFIDADHIRLDTVAGYLASSDFFTIDVADSIGQPADPAEVQAFVGRHPELGKPLSIPGITKVIRLSEDATAKIAGKYLRACQEAAAIYRQIVAEKSENVVIEVSMDETDEPQTPPELLIILALLAEAKIPLQTIAPKFTGRFNKGVDYVGDLTQFEQEFSDDVAVCAFAAREYGLPETLKLSVHSGSDKFSLYPVIHRITAATGAGVHLKTAGTTWLEELIGLAEAGGDGLQLVRDVYAYALGHREQLCGPYATVIDIDAGQLPTAAAFHALTGPDTAAMIRHIPTDSRFNPNVRQLLHIAFKVAAGEGSRYTDLLVEHRAIVAKQVTDNLFERHMKPLFLG
jgi:hypothetical protein